jgi:hypothetical protein
LIDAALELCDARWPPIRGNPGFAACACIVERIGAFTRLGRLSSAAA